MSSKLDHLVFYVAKEHFEKVVVSIVKVSEPLRTYNVCNRGLRLLLRLYFMTRKAWYLAALAPLKYEKLMDFGETVGLGAKPSKNSHAALQNS